jgi:hypothetical protein
MFTSRSSKSCASYTTRMIANKGSKYKQLCGAELLRDCARAFRRLPGVFGTKSPAWPNAFRITGRISAVAA